MHFLDKFQPVFQLQIGTFFPCPIHFNSLIANMLIFRVDDSMDLFERGRIQCIFEESVRMVELGRSFLDCGLELQVKNACLDSLF